MTSVSRGIQNDIVHHALHALYGDKGGLDGLLDRAERHDEPLHNDVFGTFVHKQRASLGGVESKSEVPAADIFDPRQSRSEYVRYDDRLRKRNPVAVNHDHCLPVLECPFQAGEYDWFYSKTANQFRRERYYVIAPLRDAQVDGAAAS